MDSFEYLIVGSGPAGVAAARRLDRGGTGIVDVGELPERELPYETLRDALAAGDLDALLGPAWEMLDDLTRPGRLHPKLRGPGLRYVARGEPFGVYGEQGEELLRGAGSYAAGGMSNAWGAQLLRYTDADLAEAGDWPLAAADLEGYYTDLESHIGIAGQLDDMADFLGHAPALLPPAPLAPAAAYLLARYTARKSGRERAGLRLGRARLALLTQPYRGFPAFRFGETDLLYAQQHGLYTARRTLSELCSAGRLTYVGGHRLLRYRELPEHVELDLLECASGARRLVRTRHLLLACGTLHSAALVLKNSEEPGRDLPFLDHPPTLVPVFFPRMLGSCLPARSFPVQLVGTLAGSGRRDMISFYYPGALLWSDLLPDLPLPMDAALGLLRRLLGGMLVAQIWETSRPSAANSLRLAADGTLRIDYPQRAPYPRLGALLRALRPLGGYSVKSLAKTVAPGWGFHYAACLPMRRRPGPFETHVDGRLWNSRRVRVLDGSVLPSLPAKNHSLTLMANAARIADETLQCGY